MEREASTESSGVTVLSDAGGTSSTEALLVEEVDVSDVSVSSEQNEASVIQVVMTTSLEILRKSSEMLKDLLSRTGLEAIEEEDISETSASHEFDDLSHPVDQKVAHQRSVKQRLALILNNCQLRLKLIEEVDHWLNEEAGLSAVDILTSASDLVEDQEPERCWQSFFAEGDRMQSSTKELSQLGQKLLQLMSGLRLDIKNMQAAQRSAEPIKIDIHPWKPWELRKPLLWKNSVEKINKVFEAMAVVCVDPTASSVFKSGKDLFNSMMTVMQSQESEIMEAEATGTDMGQRCEVVAQRRREVEKELEEKQGKVSRLKHEYTRLNQKLPKLMKDQNTMQSQVRRLNAAIDIEHARLIPVQIPASECVSQVTSARKERKKKLRKKIGEIVCEEIPDEREDPDEVDQLKMELRTQREMVRNLQQKVEKAKLLVQGLDREKQDMIKLYQTSYFVVQKTTAASQKRIHSKDEAADVPNDLDMKRPDTGEVEESEGSGQSTDSSQISTKSVGVQTDTETQRELRKAESSSSKRSKSSVSQKAASGSSASLPEIVTTTANLGDGTEELVSQDSLDQLKPVLQSEVPLEQVSSSSTSIPAPGATGLSLALSSKKSEKSRGSSFISGDRDSSGCSWTRRRFSATHVHNADILKIELNNTEGAVHSVLQSLQQLRLNLSEALVNCCLEHHAANLQQLHSAEPAETAEEELPPSMVHGGIEETLTEMEETLSQAFVLIKQRGMSVKQQTRAETKLTDFVQWREANAELQGKELEFCNDLDQYKTVWLSYLSLWAEYDMQEPTYEKKLWHEQQEEREKKSKIHSVMPLHYGHKMHSRTSLQEGEMVEGEMKEKMEEEYVGEEGKGSRTISDAMPEVTGLSREEEHEAIGLPLTWEEDVQMAHEAFKDGSIPYDVYLEPLVLMAKLAVVMQQKISLLGTQFHELRIKYILSKKVKDILGQITSERVRVQTLFEKAGIHEYTAQFHELEETERRIRVEQEYLDIITKLKFAHKAIRNQLTQRMLKSRMDTIDSETSVEETGYEEEEEEEDKEHSREEERPYSGKEEGLAHSEDTAFQVSIKTKESCASLSTRPSTGRKESRGTTPRSSEKSAELTKKPSEVAQQIPGSRERAQSTSRLMPEKQDSTHKRKSGKQQDPSQRKKSEKLEDPSQRKKSEKLDPTSRKKSKMREDPTHRKKSEKLEDPTHRKKSEKLEDPTHIEKSEKLEDPTHGRKSEEQEAGSSEEQPKTHDLRRHSREISKAEWRRQRSQFVEHEMMRDMTRINSLDAAGSLVVAGAGLHMQGASEKGRRSSSAGRRSSAMQAKLSARSGSLEGESSNVQGSVFQVPSCEDTHKLYTTPEPPHDMDDESFLDVAPNWVPFSGFEPGSPSSDLKEPVREMSAPVYRTSDVDHRHATVDKDQVLGGASKCYEIDTDDFDIYVPRTSYDMFDMSVFKPPGGGKQPSGKLGSVKEMATARPSDVPSLKKSSQGKLANTEGGHFFRPAKSQVRGYAVKGLSPRQAGQVSKPTFQPSGAVRLMLGASASNLAIVGNDQSSAPSRQAVLRPEVGGLSVTAKPLTGSTLQSRADAKRKAARLEKKPGRGSQVPCPSDRRFERGPPFPYGPVEKLCRTVVDTRKYHTKGLEMAERDGTVSWHLSGGELEKKAVEELVGKILPPRARVMGNKPLNQPFHKGHPLDMNVSHMEVSLSAHVLQSCLENLPEATSLTKAQQQTVQSRVRLHLAKSHSGEELGHVVTGMTDGEEVKESELLAPAQAVHPESVDDVDRWVLDNEVEMEMRRSGLCTRLPRISKPITTHRAVNRVYPTPTYLMVHKRFRDAPEGAKTTSPPAPSASVWYREGQQTMDLMVPRLMYLEANQSHCRAGRILRLMQHHQLQGVANQPRCQHLWNKFLCQK